MNGFRSPHKLLNEYIKEYTYCLSGDTGEPFASNGHKLKITVQTPGFVWDRLELGRVVLQRLIEIR